MKKNYKNLLNNKEGFTLVELLAVIVVLAIIMIIAIPSVMNTMNSAKQGAFKVEAQKILQTAQSQFQSDQMMNSLPTTTMKTGTDNDIAYTQYCYSLSDLGVTSGDTYFGFVLVHINDNTNDASYAVALTDASWNTTGQDANVHDTIVIPYEKLSSSTIVKGVNKNLRTDAPAATAINCTTNYNFMTFAA